MMKIYALLLLLGCYRVTALEDREDVLRPDSVESFDYKLDQQNKERYERIENEKCEQPTELDSISDGPPSESTAVSNAREVTLLNVPRSVSGVYQCEVSADAPLFHTDIKSAVMTVVEVPVGLPTITVDRLKFAQGGPLIADCIAPPSSPASNLTWFVNDQKVPGSTATAIMKHENSLETASSRLELSGAGPNAPPGPVRLRCEASLFKIFRVSSVEVEVKPDSPPKPASVLGHSLSGSPRCCLPPTASYKITANFFLITLFFIMS